MGRACGSQGQNRKVYKTLVGKPGGNKRIRQPRRRRETNIKMERVDWINVGHDRDRQSVPVNTVMKRGIP
jgi:hypothetical protein